MTWGVDWRCADKGCFNDLCRLKFQVFSDCFPRGINFTDVDGLTEVGGNFCMLEWKNSGGCVKTGQHLAFQRFTDGNSNIVFVVHGSAKDMSVKSFGYYWHGTFHAAKEASLDDLKDAIRGWTIRSDGQRQVLAA